MGDDERILKPIKSPSTRPSRGLIGKSEGDKPKSNSNGEVEYKIVEVCTNNRYLAHTANQMIGFLSSVAVKPPTLGGGYKQLSIHYNACINFAKIICVKTLKLRIQDKHNDKLNRLSGAVNSCGIMSMTWVTNT